MTNIELSQPFRKYGCPNLSAFVTITQEDIAPLNRLRKRRKPVLQKVRSEANQIVIKCFFVGITCPDCEAAWLTTATLGQLGKEFE